MNCAVRFRACQIGPLTTKEGKLMVIGNTSLGGGIENWKMGDVFGGGQRMNGSMAKRMTFLDSARRTGLFTASKRKLMVDGNAL